MGRGRRFRREKMNTGRLRALFSWPSCRCRAAIEFDESRRLPAAIEPAISRSARFQPENIFEERWQIIVCDEAFRPHRVAYLRRLGPSSPDRLRRKQRMQEFNMAQVENVVRFELVIRLSL